MIGARREKVFGPGRCVPLDRNAKVRIAAYARAWSARNRRPGQHKGPITRAFLEVLQALLWSFHNSRDGRCFPSYERIADQARCARSTVAEALKVLEWAGVLTWQNRITRAVVRQRDLFGRWSNRWTVIRTSNAYAFRDPQQSFAGVSAAKSEKLARTQDQDVLDPVPSPARDLDTPLEHALARFGAAVAARNGIEQDDGALAGVG
jgi:helix-turn-helix protein